MSAPARSARGPSCDSRWRLVSQAMIVRARRRGGDRQRLAARSRAQVDDQPIRRGAGQRDQLAALVLDLDLPSFIFEAVVDTRVGGQPQSPRAEPRGLGAQTPTP